MKFSELMELANNDLLTSKKPETKGDSLADAPKSVKLPSLRHAGDEDVDTTTVEPGDKPSPNPISVDNTPPKVREANQDAAKLQLQNIPAEEIEKRVKEKMSPKPDVPTNTPDDLKKEHIKSGTDSVKTVDGDDVSLRTPEEKTKDEQLQKARAKMPNQNVEQAHVALRDRIVLSGNLYLAGKFDDAFAVFCCALDHISESPTASQDISAAVHDAFFASAHPSQEIASGEEMPYGQLSPAEEMMLLASDFMEADLSAAEEAMNYIESLRSKVS